MTLIPGLVAGVSIRVAPGFFPIPRPRQPDQAGGMNTTDTQSEAISQPTSSMRDTAPGRPPLRRLADGRILGGVAAGVADYFDVDATIVRIALVVLTFFGGAGIPLYLAGWLLIPEEGSDQSLASELLQSISARPR
jgi:phage shock protein C